MIGKSYCRTLRKIKEYDIKNNNKLLVIGSAGMKKAVAIFLYCLITFGSIAWAAPTASDIQPSSKELLVVVFVNKFIQDDKQAMDIVRNTIQAKFNNANISIYGYQSTPEFLDFIEKLQTNPANEGGIKAIGKSDLLEYGKAMNAKHIILINLFNMDSDTDFWSGTFLVEMMEDVTAFDVQSQKIIFNQVFGTEKKFTVRKGAELLMTKLQTEFKWTPLAANDNMGVPGDKKVLVAVFLTNELLGHKDLLAKIRNAINEKFGFANVYIYKDGQAKPPEYIEFIGRVTADSAKQRMMVITKDNLSQFGRDLGTGHVILIKIDRSREDISVVSVENGKYVASVLYVAEKMSVPETVEFLMNKLKNDFQFAPEKDH